MMKLTPKQENFCLEYRETGIASEAYRRTYDVSRTSPKSINERACKLLANTKIAARIQEIQGRILEKLVWEKQHSLQILAGIARDTIQSSPVHILQGDQEAGRSNRQNNRPVHVIMETAADSYDVVRMVCHGIDGDFIRHICKEGRGDGIPP